MKIEIRTGERQAQHKLTDSDIGEIHRLTAEGWTRKELAERFSVSTVLIGLVLRGVRTKTRTVVRF